MVEIKNLEGEVLLEVPGNDLRGANLQGANLRRANLWRADLRRANLWGAGLRGANLQGANLWGANLRGANLQGSYLWGADFQGANLLGAVLPEGVPVIENLDQKILERLELGKGELDMKEWHTCETTHCRAGWAITLAGDAGAKLENRFGPSVAGALLYAKAYPNLPIPDFHALNEEAMEDIKQRAAL